MKNLQEAAIIPKPQYKVTLKGTPMTVVFGVNDDPTKTGITMRFTLDQPTNNAAALNEIASQITTILQKKFADNSLEINRDTEVKDPSTIGYIIPLTSVTSFMMNKIVKGGA